MVSCVFNLKIFIFSPNLHIAWNGISKNLPILRPLLDQFLKKWVSFDIILSKVSKLLQKVMNFGYISFFVIFSYFCPYTTQKILCLPPHPLYCNLRTFYTLLVLSVRFKFKTKSQNLLINLTPNSCCLKQSQSIS